jgi:hypothetical protein
MIAMTDGSMPDHTRSSRRLLLVVVSEMARDLGERLLAALRRVEQLYEGSAIIMTGTLRFPVTTVGMINARLRFL